MSVISVDLHTIDDKVKFAAVSRENPEIVLDYFPPYGEGKGYTSLELLLVSLGSCLSTTVITLMRDRMRKSVAGLSLRATGTTRETHPKAFTHIQLEMELTSPDAGDEDLRKAIAVSEEKLCPVWAMLKGNVEIQTEFRILRP